ncbi:MAG: hypothetical protein AB7F31_02055 [Parachlamydiales bacterium]
MPRNRIYAPLFLALVGIAVLFLCGRAAYSLWGYLRLDGEAAAQIERWEVRQTGTDTYRLFAHYNFEHRGKRWAGEGRYGGRRFPNRVAAEAKLVQLREVPLTAYFPTKKPRESVLSRLFPLKRVIYALIGLGVAVYFAILIGLSKDHAAV